MFKFVVICAFFAAAVAEPQLGFLSAEPAIYSSVYNPAFTSQASIHPSPYFYSAPAYTSSLYGSALPLAHLIKKRSAPTHGAPTTNVDSDVVTAAEPALYSPDQSPASQYGAERNVNKRSAALTYFAPSYAYPTTTYSSYSSLYPGGYYNAYPASYNYYPYAASAHLIKKRSVALYPTTSTYIAPTSYASSPFYTTYASSSPIISSPYLSNPYLYSTYIKK